MIGTATPSAPVILCATQRLARRLRLDAVSRAAGGVCALPLTLTIGQWLAATIEAALLSGELPVAQAPQRVLTEFQERLLWQQVLSKALRGKDDAALFSVAGLAASAQEAHALCEVWQIEPPTTGSEEQVQFADWRRRFLRRCAEQGWHDAGRHLVWQVDCVAAGVGTLPPAIERAGFDRFNPQEDRLFAALAARGVAIFDRQAAHGCPVVSGQYAYPDAVTQFRAMARWTREQLAATNPAAAPEAASAAETAETAETAGASEAVGVGAGAPALRIGLVVPDLEQHRFALTRALDQELDPAALRPGAAQAQRLYNVSLGERLARVPFVDVALQLLRLGLSAYRVDQAALGRLLLSPYWSADQSEADTRAVFEARCRRKLSATTSLQAVLRLATRTREDGLPIAALVGHFERLLGWSARVAGRRAAYSAWAAEFRWLLDALGWPGERSLSSQEFQAREAFLAQLAEFGELDAVLGETTAGDALATLADACGRQLFQAQTEGAPPVEVLGLLEAVGERFDALWVAGMTDDVWPPPVRTNPLLPAALQRAKGCPNASPEVQRAFAGSVHARFLHVVTPRPERSTGALADTTLAALAPKSASSTGALAGTTLAVMAPKSASSAGHLADMTLADPPQVVFSWPAFEGERALRRSPLLGPAEADEGGPATPDARPGQPPPADPLAERLRAATPDAMESRPDHRAPPVVEAGRLRGGTWLLRAQAICPAWAFYQYRLGAEELEAPSDGLDARDRGSLLHWVLEAFWQGADSEAVRARAVEAQRAAVRAAVAAGLAAYDAANPVAPLPPRLRGLEQARLEALLAAWVDVELARPEPFVVVACEEQHELSIEGIEARVTVDRIDALPDGRRVVLDYKTGASVDAKSWAAERIVEPQLPIYATWAVAPAPLAAIAFAQVRADKMRFVGIAESPGLLTKVDALAEARKLYAEDRFPDWAALLVHWRRALSAVAAEIRSGDARIVFADEKQLEHCPVRPLLRLAERRQQREAALAGAVPSPATKPGSSATTSATTAPETSPTASPTTTRTFPSPRPAASPIIPPCAEEA